MNDIEKILKFYNKPKIANCRDILIEDPLSDED